MQLMKPRGKIFMKSYTNLLTGVVLSLILVGNISVAQADCPKDKPLDVTDIAKDIGVSTSPCKNIAEMEVFADKNRAAYAKSMANKLRKDNIKDDEPWAQSLGLAIAGAGVPGLSQQIANELGNDIKPQTLKSLAN